MPFIYLCTLIYFIYLHIPSYTLIYLQILTNIFTYLHILQNLQYSGNEGWHETQKNNCHNSSPRASPRMRIWHKASHYVSKGPCTLKGAQHIIKIPVLKSFGRPSGALIQLIGISPKKAPTAPLATSAHETVRLVREVFQRLSHHLRWWHCSGLLACQNTPSFNRSAPPNFNRSLY